MKDQSPLTAVSESGDFFRTMIHAAPLPMFVVSEASCIYGNEKFRKLRGCVDAHCVACGLERLLGAADQHTLEQTIHALPSGEVARMQLNMLQHAGKQTAIDLVISGMQVSGKNVALGVISERTEKERIRRLLDRLAFHDTLTQLPNRVLLFDRINQSLSRFNREGDGFAIAILDLDGFKQINDKLGHAAGDFLLKAVSQRLSECMRSVDTVARLGGDEFALIIQGVSNEDEADLVLRKIILEISKPFVPNELELQVSASIGIAFCPHDGSSIHELLGRADFAMYQAKRDGGSCYRVSTGEIASISSRLELEPLIDVIKLGFDIIDEQHEEIASCIRGILRSLSGDDEHSGIKRRAEYLLQIVEEHFGTEEDLMLRYAVSGQDEHRLEHKDLMKQLHELLPNHEGHGLTVMTHSFKDWLVPHIQEQDTLLVDRLNAAGVNGR